MVSKSGNKDDGQEIDSKALYKDITTFVKDAFKPQYTVYQKYMIEQKLQCYKKFEGQPANYFDCIEDIEAKMKSNAELLQQKYSQVEISDQVCQETCLNSFDSGKHRQNCLVKCAKAMREQVISTYNSYYDLVLSGSPEYKKLKRPS